MECWRLGLCVQGGGAKAVTPVRRWGAWGRGEEVEGGGSELAGHSSTYIWGLLGRFLELARVMWLCPAGLGGDEVWLGLNFLILLVLGVLNLGCSVTPSQTPAVSVSKQCLTAPQSGKKASCLADQASSSCPFFLLWILHLFFTLL